VGGQYVSRNCRLIISNEVDENATLNGSLIKKLASGGDKITAELKDVLITDSDYLLSLYLKSV
jgi:hypothetical protein